jgi:hypothetical protein
MSKGSLAPLDEHFATRILPSIAAERMGAPTGTALNAWENVISGKARDAKQAKMWMDLGLLDPKKVDLNSHGAPISWQAGAVRNTGLAQRDPLAWTEKEMLPALQKHGYDINDPEKLQQALNTLFRNSNANLFATDLSDPKSRLRLHKDERLMDEVMTPDRGYKYMLENDPTQGLKSITAALQDLGQAVTGPGMQQIGSVLSSISGGVKSFAQVLQDHPHLATAGGITAASAGIGGAGWFASQMAGGFGLSKSATELDGAAAALTRAAGALGGGKAGELAADAAGAGSAAKPSRLRRFGRLAGRTLKALPVAGLVADAADTLRDIEVAHGAGQQPGAVNEGYDSILGSPRRVPFVPEKPKEYDAFRDALEAHQRDSQPGWTVNQPQKAFPMTGAGGATAGVEGPEFPNVTGLNGASGVADALNIGSQTQAAGAASGAGYLEGLRSQLDAAASYAEEIAQRIRNALDFSVSPSIGSSSSSTPNPGRQSSLIHTDHGRASAAGGAGWSLG